ncbi:hypothetical protein LCGC14_3128930, partial [marine sediment metagenome]
MKLFTTLVIILALVTSPALAQVEFKDGRVWIHGERQD